MSNFKPEEVQVKITKSLIKIEAKQESEFSSRSFYKEFTIPYGVKADTIQCTMNDEGILTISAPIQQHQQQAISQSTSTSVSTSTSTNVQQQQSQQQQQQVQQKRLQETGRTDSRESTTSTASSVRESATRRLEDMILRPIRDFDFDAIMNTRGNLFEDVTKQVRQLDVNEGKKFEVF